MAASKLLHRLGLGLGIDQFFLERGIVLIVGHYLKFLRHVSPVGDIVIQVGKNEVIGSVIISRMSLAKKNEFLPAYIKRDRDTTSDEVIDWIGLESTTLDGIPKKFLFWRNTLVDIQKQEEWLAGYLVFLKLGMKADATVGFPVSISHSSVESGVQVHPNHEALGIYIEESQRAGITLFASTLEFMLSDLDTFESQSDKRLAVELYSVALARIREALYTLR